MIVFKRILLHSSIQPPFAETFTNLVAQDTSPINAVANPEKTRDVLAFIWVQRSMGPVRREGVKKYGFNPI
ncbi:MAG: hypothetical protein KAS38_11030 [Anaerolineales bacterium]|nr:hypothetical protein [Anaerolineales bacterium]